MKYFLRYTSNLNEKEIRSEDQVNKKMLSGLCAYDISEYVAEMISEDYSIEDAFAIISKKQAESDNWHAHNSKGQFVIFSGSVIEYDRDNIDYKGNRAVVAKMNKYEAIGHLEQTKHGYRVKDIILSK